LIPLTQLATIFKGIGMAGIKIPAFTGISPKVANRLLPDTAAQIADNCRLLSGGLRSFSDKLQITTNTLETEILSFMRMSDGVSDYWLSWSKDVDYVRSQIAGDTAQRIYWTGDNEPRESNLAMAIAGGGLMPNSCFVMGVTAPLVAPTVTPSGGSGASVSRAYVETFVTPWGEESAPSPVSTVTTGKVDDTWALTALNAAPPNTATISGATHASGVVTITASSKHLRVGEELVHSGIGGMTDLNGHFVIYDIPDTTHYKVLLTTAQTYTSGGEWARVAPHNTTGMTRRIYRTLSGEYFFVAEIAIGTTTYNDTKPDAGLGETLKTTGWDMPPTGLKGIIALANGSNAGFIGNEIMMSEPWQPHAWPTEYAQAIVFEVVGIAALGTSVVVGTKGNPYIITGSHPSNTSMEKAQQLNPCLSKRSMIDIGVGVLYSSPDGLAFESGAHSEIATMTQFSRDEWSLLNPSSIRCSHHNGMVFGWHDKNASLHTGFAFNINTGAFASLSMPSTASYVDPETGKMYVANGGVIYQWDAHPYNDITYDWKSKVFSVPRPINFGYARIDTDFSPAEEINNSVADDTAYNETVLASGITDGELDASMLDEYTLDGSLLRGGSFAEYSTKSLRLTVIADGVEKYTETVSNSKSFSLPSGFKAHTWEFRMSGNMPCFGIYVAESATELRSM